MHLNNIILTCLLFLVLFAVQHAAAAGFYVDAGVMQMQAEFSDIERDPVLGRAKAGYYFTNRASVELQVAATVNKDKKADSELAPSILGLYVRYGSSAASRGRFYLHAGVARTTVVDEIAGEEFSEDFDDVSAGLGMEERLKSLPNASVTLEYTRYHSKDDAIINGLTLGFRTDF